MVRYIRNDELYHYQVKGAKHGVRRYQYPDGSYTPLGRIHYGIGEYKNKTVGEKLLETPKALKNTLATYGYGKYKAKANPSGKYNSTERKFMKKADKARAERLKEKEEKKANAEAAAKKRLEETRARAEEKNKEAVEARKKIEDEEARNREKYKEEADKRADERAKQLEERVKELGKEIDERVKGKGEEPANGREEAKSGRFEGFSNEELKKFTERTKLEAEASKAVYEARMAKLGAGQDVIRTLVGYGKIGVDAFNMYKSVRGAIDEYNGMHVQSQMQRYADDLLKDIDDTYQKGDLKDPKKAAEFKEDIWRRQQMIEAVGKVFSMTKSNYRYEQKPKDGDGKKNNQQDNGNNNQPKDDGSNNQSKKDKKKNKQQNGNNDGSSNNQSNENEQKNENHEKNNQPKNDYNINIYNYGNDYLNRQSKTNNTNNQSKNTMTRTEVANAIEKIVRRETDSSTEVLNKRVDKLTEMVMNASNSKVSVSNAQMESFMNFMNDYLIDG